MRPPDVDAERGLITPGRFVEREGQRDQAVEALHTHDRNGDLDLPFLRDELVVDQYHQATGTGRQGRVGRRRIAGPELLVVLAHAQFACQAQYVALQGGVRGHDLQCLLVVDIGIVGLASQLVDDAGEVEGGRILEGVLHRAGHLVQAGIGLRHALVGVAQAELLCAGIALGFGDLLLVSLQRQALLQFGTTDLDRGALHVASHQVVEGLEVIQHHRLIAGDAVGEHVVIDDDGTGLCQPAAHGDIGLVGLCLDALAGGSEIRHARSAVALDLGQTPTLQQVEDAVRSLDFAAQPGALIRRPPGAQILQQRVDLFGVGDEHARGRAAGTGQQQQQRRNATAPGGRQIHRVTPQQVPPRVQLAETNGATGLFTPSPGKALAVTARMPACRGHPSP